MQSLAEETLTERHTKGIMRVSFDNTIGKEIHYEGPNSEQQDGPIDANTSLRDAAQEDDCAAPIINSHRGGTSGEKLLPEPFQTFGEADLEQFIHRMETDGIKCKIIDSDDGTMTYSGSRNNEEESIGDINPGKKNRFSMINGIDDQLFDFDRKMTKAQMRRQNFQKASTKYINPTIVRNIRNQATKKQMSVSFIGGFAIEEESNASQTGRQNRSKHASFIRSKSIKSSQQPRQQPKPHADSRVVLARRQPPQAKYDQAIKSNQKAEQERKASNNRWKQLSKSAKPIPQTARCAKSSTWGTVKVKDACEESEMSVTTKSDSEDDYLIMGLNVRTQGDITHLKKSKQKKILKHRTMATEQGGFKFIPPLMGSKVKTEVNDGAFHQTERRKACPVEWYERDKVGRKIIYPSHKCDWIGFMRSVAEERQIATEKLLKQFKDSQGEQQLKVMKYKYQVQSLKNCKDNTQMMGENKVKLSAEQQFLLIQEDFKDHAIQVAGGMNMDLLQRFYGDKTKEQQTHDQEVNEYKLLHNYIEKYQEKLGLYGTNSKKSEVEKVLAFSHKDLVRKANEVYIDFNSYKTAKNQICAKKVKSTLRTNAEKRGFPQEYIDQFSPTEVSMQTIKQAMKDNKYIRKQMVDCFRGGSNNIHNVIDEIRETMLSEANEENKEMLENLKKTEEEKKKKFQAFSGSNPDATQKSKETKDWSSKRSTKIKIKVDDFATTEANSGVASPINSIHHLERGGDGIGSDLSKLLSETWFERPKSSNVTTGRKTSRYDPSRQQQTTMASTATKVNSRGILSGRTDNRLEPCSPKNKGMFMQLGSVNNDESIISGGNLMMHLVSPRPALRNSARSRFGTTTTKASNVDHKSATKRLGSVRREGSLAGIFHTRQQKYKPSKDIATPDLEIVKHESRAEMQRIGRQARRACFSIESLKVQNHHKNISAYKMSNQYKSLSKVHGEATLQDDQVSKPEQFQGSQSLLSENKKETNAEPTISPSRSVKEVVFEEIRHFENLVNESYEKNSTCRNGLRPNAHPKNCKIKEKGSGSYMVDGIKSLQKESNKIHKTLTKETTGAVNYVKSAQCIQRAGMSQLNKRVDRR